MLLLNINILFSLLRSSIIYIFHQLPTVGTVIEGNPALNRVSWTASGQHVAVGDSLGKVWLYDVGEVSFIKLKLFF